MEKVLNSYFRTKQIKKNEITTHTSVQWNDIKSTKT